MFVKLMCVALVCRGAVACDGPDTDALLRALGGAGGGNKLNVCAGGRERAGAVRCDAALWRRRWAVVRASCVGARRLAQERVLRDSDGDTCGALDGGTRARAAALRVRTVVSRGVHPAWHGSRAGGGGDLALLQLDRAYEQYDTVSNYTTAKRLLQEFEPWMEKVFKLHRKHAQQTRPPPEVTAALPPRLLATPLSTICITVLLPTGLFFVFFYVVTHCTGTAGNIPYQNIHNYVATSPWIELKTYPLHEMRVAVKAES